METKKIENLQDRLTTYGNKIGAKLTICKSDKGYFITYNDSPQAVTSGRTYKELAAYIDGFRDMLLIRASSPTTVILDAIPHLEWMVENLTGHGGTEVNGRWYYTWEQAMAAAAGLDDGWRLPTREEFKVLADIGSVWDDAKKGRLFGKELFLEAAGYINCLLGALWAHDIYGYYWSSAPYYSGGARNSRLGFYSGDVFPLDDNSREYGCSVRLVREIKA